MLTKTLFLLPIYCNKTLLPQDQTIGGLASFTYIATKEGWLYVATVLDLFSRKIVGLSMKERMTDDLVIDALNQALKHREPQIGLLHHSDRGSGCTSQGFQKELKKHGITC